MNFIFDSCFFQKNSTFNQSSTTLLPQNRIPFTDVTQQMNSFFNTKKNQQINIFPKYFNDFSNDKENITFLKKKSFGEKINNIEKDEECTDHNNTLNMHKKFLNNCYKMQNPLINSLKDNYRYILGTVLALYSVCSVEVGSVVKLNDNLKENRLSCMRLVEDLKKFGIDINDQYNRMKMVKLRMVKQPLKYYYQNLNKC